jgi:hypothetical protein
MWHPRAHSARPWWRFFRNTAAEAYNRAFARHELAISLAR